MSNDKDLLKSLKPLPLKRGPLSLLTDTGMPSETKVFTIFSFTTLAPLEVINSAFAHLDYVQPVHTFLSRVQ